MAKNEVAKKEEGAVVDADFFKELTQDADTYKEALSQDDMSMPFLQLLQGLSPACVEGDAAYIEGARPGMVMDSTDKVLYDVKKNPLTIIPIAYKASYVEWIPRNNNGGGFVTEHSLADGQTAITVRNDSNEDIIQPGSPVGTPGNDLKYTHTHFIMVKDDNDGTFRPAVIALVVSQIKHSRKFNRMVNSTKLPGTAKAAPRFFGVYELSSILETKGDKKFHSWAFKRIGDVTTVEGGKEIYQSAKEFNDSLNFIEFIGGINIEINTVSHT